MAAVIVFDILGSKWTFHPESGGWNQDEFVKISLNWVRESKRNSGKPVTDSRGLRLIYTDCKVIHCYNASF